MRHGRTAAEGEGEGQELDRHEWRRQRTIRARSWASTTQTNNFLGLGETLSVQANLGSISRTFLFGFTQPYIRNRPINVGFQIFNNKQDYNAAKNYQATTGASLNLSTAEKSLTQNYNVGSDGINFSVSYPLKRHAFQRVGMTYSLTKSTITAFSTASQTFFQTIAFRSGVQGSNPLAGIINSNHRAQLHLRHGQQSAAPARGQGIHGVRAGCGHLGQRALHQPGGGVQALHPHALPDPHRRRAAMCWAVRAQLGYIQGIWRRCGAAQQPLLRRRRAGTARL